MFLGRKPKPEKPDGLPALYTGMRAEILTPANRLIFVARITVLKDWALQITDEGEENVPWVEYNTQIKIRGFQQNGEPFAMYGYVCGSTNTFWKVDRLQTLQKEELRKYYRQMVNLPGTVMCVSQIFSSGAGQANNEPLIAPCTILDISGGGARIRCSSEPAFQVGDWLFLGMDDPLRSDSRLNYTCCIRRVVEDRNCFEYGCEFDSLTDAEQERLLQIVMTVQQRELRARRRNQD